jgi:hypothetical protein
MMTTLEDLYYGNINPHEMYINRGSQVDRLVKLIYKNEEALISTLTEQQKETFDKFKECQSELCDLTARQAFTDGFVLATRIMVEVMNGIGTAEDV